jgi:sn-glycerol 3-phosphate transport system permease protein
MSMLKRAHFARSPWTGVALVAPQLLITFVFFFWPALQAVSQAFRLTDPFGTRSLFVGLENFAELLTMPEYLGSFAITLRFSALVCAISLGLGLLLSVAVNRLRKLRALSQTLLLWPYAIAPAMSGVLWLFIFHPSYGSAGHLLDRVVPGGWNPILEGSHAMALVVLASAWKQVSYNFIFFLSGLQAIPRSVLEAAALDGAGPIRRFFSIVLPLLSPTVFFLIVMNTIYAFFDTFGAIHATTHGGPGGATQTLVYRAYTEGFVGQDLGSSAAQSVILMVLTLGFMVFQFRYLERKVHYGGKR